MQRTILCTTNKTVVLDDELAKMPYGEQVSKLTVLDDETISANQADWAERWNRKSKLAFLWGG